MGTRTHRLIWTLLLFMVLGLPGVPAVAQPCPHDGDVNGDGTRTPADVLLAFQHYLQIIALDACRQARADVDDNGSVTPADALCLFKAFLGLDACLNGKTFEFIIDLNRIGSTLHRLQ